MTAESSVVEDDGMRGTGDKGFEGLPSLGRSAMTASDDRWAGLALFQLCNSTLGVPLLKVPVCTLIVLSLGLLSIPNGPWYLFSKPWGLSSFR